jgi:hypothetical protein
VMIYLSANGEVLGQFKEQAVPGLMADGTITGEAFFWREGMSEWRPVMELAGPETKKLEEPEVSRPAPVELKPVVELPGSEPKSAVVLPKPAESLKKKPFVARRGPGDAVPSAVAPIAAVPVASAPKPVGAQQPVAAVKTVQPESGASLAEPVVVGAGAPNKGRGWLVWLAGLVIFVAAAGGGAWWWIANAEPPVIAGSVALAGDESGAVQVRVFRRAELAAPWRERLAAVEARAAELDGELAQAQAALREKSVLLEEAAGVLKVGEEYNMADVEELRSEHDAKKAAAEEAEVAVAKLESEKAALLTFEGLLERVPAPLGTVVADPTGMFSLPPPEEDVVLLATATVEVDGQRQQRAWLEVLELPLDGEAPGAVRFSEMNRLDLQQIRRFAAAE